jgi:TraM recognition site of TraD and TraG
MPAASPRRSSLSKTSAIPTLFLLDEFAGLKRMEVIENAAAQAAGFGIKFMFVVQNLAQLNEVYDKSWETFFGNSGLKLFFQIDDDFSRSYLSRQLGELETVRQTRSGSTSQSASTSDTRGFSSSNNTGGGSTSSPWLGIPKSQQYSWGRSTSRSRSTSRGSSASSTDGWGEGVHKRPLLNPDEIGRLLARVDDRRRPGYPGLVLALVPGEHPLLARRVNYFESNYFLGYFDPHPNHPPPPTLAALAARARAATPMPKQLPPAAPLSPRLRKFLLDWIVMPGLAIAVGGGLFAYFSVMRPDIMRAVVRGTGPQGSQPQEAAAPTTAYAQGAADFDAQKAWFDEQSGDRRAGADYWAANRSIRGHASCGRAAEDYSGDQQEFIAGCQDAARVLRPIDARRADAQYRAGFNDEANR